MNKSLIFLLLASFSLASEVNLSTPSDTVQSYYNAVNEGDLIALKQIMVKESYDTDVQVYALSIALRDADFHKTLKQYSVSENSKQIVEKEVAKKLKERKNKTITIEKEISLGTDRVMVKFSEGSRKKQLYLSALAGQWKINYLAGRKTN